MTSDARPAVVVLAAGLGKRFHSRVPKVLQRAAGLPLLEHVLRTIQPIQPARLVVVVGNGKERVTDYLSAKWPVAEIVEQTELLGTADAVRRCRSALAEFEGPLVVLPGDTPLLRPESVMRLVRVHQDGGHLVSLLTASLPDPTGYGRIIREPGGAIRIVEEADAMPEQRLIKEISGGFWCFEPKSLFEALDQIDNSNAQGEFYLPDAAVVISRRHGMLTVPLDDPDEVKGVNDRNQLSEAASILRLRHIERLGAEGVTFEDPASTFIDEAVTIGKDTVIRPMTFLEGNTSIGSGCTIGPSTRIVDSTVEDGAEVTFAVVRESSIGPRSQVGPFASLRPGTVLAEGAKVGTFVETKASSIGPGSKVPHLSYIGDAEIGQDVNVGAGTITCNYDGETKIKSKTVIEDEVLIGSDTMLVAPVTMGKRSVTGAGSVVTKDVEEAQVVAGVPARPVRTRKPPPGGSAR